MEQRECKFFPLGKMIEARYQWHHQMGTTHITFLNNEKVPISIAIRPRYQDRYWVTGIWKPKLNLELIQKVQSKIATLEKQFGPICFQWVKGHAKDPWNNRVDQLAKEAINQSFFLRKNST